MEELLKIAIESFNRSLTTRVAEHFGVDIRHINVRAKIDGTFEVFKGNDVIFRYREPVVTNDPDSETIDYRFSVFKRP